ncbi:MAG: DUF1700 domain-containing protein [Bdellovibrionota bacterium]
MPNEQHDYASKEDYLAAFRSELEARGSEALSSSFIERALDDVEEKFETLLGRGRTPTAIAETLGSPKDRAEVVIAMRLLRLQPGSEHGPELITYLRVIRSLAIVAPVNLILALVPAFAVVAAIASGFVGCAWVFLLVMTSAFAFFTSARGLEYVVHVVLAAQFIGLAAGAVFVGCVLVHFLKFGSFVWWKWIRWNVNFLMREVA